MFESKMSTKSAYGQLTSLNSSNAPGFIPIPCPSHPEYSITNICKAQNCIQPLCPECIANHVQLHQQSKKPAKIQNIITTRVTCIQQLAKMKYEAKKEIEEFMAASSGNVEEFLEAHRRRLDTAYKKVMKIVEDMFGEMNKQMQIIANAYITQKQKKQKQSLQKLSPLTDYLHTVSDYKQQLQSEDYIPALIELLNEPPKKPKYDPPTQGQNFGSVQVNQKYLEDVKEKIGKFVYVVVKCKDEGFKARVEMNRTAVNGSNYMRFSRFGGDRDRSRDGRDGSQSRMGDSRRSNSKKKIFGCESIISDIKPGSSSRIEINNNSVYQGPNQQFNPQQKPLQQIKYCSYSTQLKIPKMSYFTNNNISLWYFKQGTKNAFRAPLQSIQAGFQKLQLKIDFLLPQNSQTIHLPTGNILLLGGKSTSTTTTPTTTSNKLHVLNQQDLTLKQLAPMIDSRELFGACYVQDFVYVFGGVCCEAGKGKWENRRVLAEGERYGLRGGVWERVAGLVEPAYGFGMCGLGTSRIVKFGGFTESRKFLHKVDIYQIPKNTWISFQVDTRFTLTSNPGLTQISQDSLLIFGGLQPQGTKSSKCYLLTQQQQNSQITITEGPELYNQATFQCAFLHDGCILAIQDNQIANRNKLIMGFKYGQWKFVSC